MFVFSLEFGVEVEVKEYIISIYVFMFSCFHPRHYYFCIKSDVRTYKHVLIPLNFAFHSDET